MCSTIGTRYANACIYWVLLNKCMLGSREAWGPELLLDDPIFQETFRDLGQIWNLSAEVFEVLEAFKCRMYSSRSPICSINELRCHLFQAKRGDVEFRQLPPSEECLVTRCHFLEFISSKCLQVKVHLKFTNTDLLLHHRSHVDNRYKLSLVHTMLSSAYHMHLSSSWATSIYWRMWSLEVLILELQ